MRQSRHRTESPALGDLSRYDLEAMGRRVLAGGRLAFAHRRAGFVVLASDLDEDSGVAAVWLARRPGSPGSAEHTLQFERDQGWRFLGTASGPAMDMSLADRPSAAVNGPASVMGFLGSGGGRSRTDWDKGLGPEGTGWVMCGGFRLAIEVARLQVGERLLPVPGHGYVVAAWRTGPDKTRPPIAAIGDDGARLSQLGPDDALDTLTWETVQKALGEDQ